MVTNSTAPVTYKPKKNGSKNTEAEKNDSKNTEAAK